VASAGDTAYDYDGNGNVNSRIGPSVPGGTQSLDYTPFDLPVTITTGASVSQFDYSADEERVVRRDPDRTRYTVGGLYERMAGLGGETLEQRFRLYAGSRQIAEVVRDASGSKTLYFHADAIGSVDTISQGNGSALTQAFDHFGAPLDAPNPALTRAGFTGHQHDNDFGLIDMKGRIYDPLAGRFMSADPITQAPFWSQGLNRYAYVFNDPVNLTDPTGFVGGDDSHRGVASYLRLGYGDGLGGSIAGGFGGALFNVGASLLTGGYGGGSSGSVRTVTPSAAPAAVGQGQGSMNAVAQNSGGVGPVQPNFELPPKGPDLR
jgi:RHS repeat-associated protein